MISVFCAVWLAMCPVDGWRAANWDETASVIEVTELFPSLSECQRLKPEGWPCHLWDEPTEVWRADNGFFATYAADTKAECEAQKPDETWVCRLWSVRK